MPTASCRHFSLCTEQSRFLKLLTLADKLVVVSCNHLLGLSRKLINQSTTGAAVPSTFLNTLITPDKQRMADLILAVVVGVTFGLFTEMAGRNDFVTDSLAETLIKDEILPFKLILQSLFFYLPCVVDNATLQVSHIFKAIVLEPRARLLATNPAGAVQCDFFILMNPEHLWSL